MISKRTWGRPVYDHSEKIFISGGADCNGIATTCSELLDCPRKKSMKIVEMTEAVYKYGSSYQFKTKQ